MSKKQFIGILPTTGSTPLEQLNDCLSKLRGLLQSSGLDVKNVLKQTVFIKADDNLDFYTSKTRLFSAIIDFYLPFLPPLSFVGQKPENNKRVSLEVILLTSQSNKIAINHKTLGDIRYSVVDYSDFKEVYAAGLTSGQKQYGTLDQARAAFELMKMVLEKEGMNFPDVVRQWNYIENILGVNSGEDGLRQNYQLFNEVRSIYYGASNFINGYPAATGIGMNTGGVILEFIAVSAFKDISIVPISNPRQVDAHRYSQEVLVGNSLKATPQKAPPKFERAKLVSIHDSGQIYISGTAAVLGQDTAPEGDVESQTLTTIENISRLISKDNLKNCGIKSADNPEPLSYLRAYVRNEADIPKVRKICQKSFRDVPALFLVSDICRNDLLMEIEGVLSI